MNSPKNDKYEQILNAAEKILAETGFQGFSMQKLAKEAGIAAGTIYLYFSDKQNLLETLRCRIAQDIANAVQADVSDDMPLKVRFTTMWRNVWSLAYTHINQLVTRVQYEAMPLEIGKRVWEWDNEQALFTKVEALFDEGKREKLFKPLDNKILIALSFEVVINLARKQALGVYSLSDEDLEAIIDACWDVIVIH